MGEASTSETKDRGIGGLRWHLRSVSGDMVGKEGTELGKALADLV
jgi:hypothetical protein